MTKKRKFKIVRAVVILLIIVFVIIMLFKTINGEANSGKTDPVVPPPTQENNENIDKNDKVTGLKIEPEKYTAHAGETIKLSDFKILKEYADGKTDQLTSSLTYEVDEADGELFVVNGDSIVVSTSAVTADKGIVKVKHDGLEASISLEILNRLEDNIGENTTVTNLSAYDVVVNKTRNISEDYVPEDLVSLTEVPTCLASPEVNQMRKDAYEALKKMFTQAKEEKSFVLYARSGYRSYNTQASLYASTVRNSGQEAADKYSAKPGQSEHQTGLAMDISCEAVELMLEETFGDTEEGIWVKENAHKFGFIIRYPKGKEDITGYNYEPWHIRYLGETLAKDVYESGLTLEEYFGK